MLRGAERIWLQSGARRSVAVPNGEGVASGSTTEINSVFQRSDFIHFQLLSSSHLAASIAATAATALQAGRCQFFLH